MSTYIYLSGHCLPIYLPPYLHVYIRIKRGGQGGSKARPRLLTDAALHRRHVIAVLGVGHLRRPHTAQGELVRRQRVCEAVRGVVAVLGRHLVGHQSAFHGGRDPRRAGGVQAELRAAAGRLEGFHPHGEDAVEDVAGVRVCRSGGGCGM